MSPFLGKHPLPLGEGRVRVHGFLSTIRAHVALSPVGEETFEKLLAWSRAHSDGGSSDGYIDQVDGNDQVELPAPTRSWQRSVPAHSSQASAWPCVCARQCSIRCRMISLISGCNPNGAVTR